MAARRPGAVRISDESCPVIEHGLVLDGRLNRIRLARAQSANTPAMVLMSLPAPENLRSHRLH
jgi:hypothetical protein